MFLASGAPCRGARAIYRGFLCLCRPHIMVPVLHLALLSAWTRATMPPYVPVAPSRVLCPQLNLLEAAMDGDISAVLEVGSPHRCWSGRCGFGIFLGEA